MKTIILARNESVKVLILPGSHVEASALQLENSKVAGKGYAEVIIGADEVAVATSPSGTAHALVNVDPVRTAFRLGCQDGIVDFNSSSTVYNIWNDL